MEKKIVLIVEYDGSAYQGYQVQKDKPTIQLEIEKALKALTGEESVKTIASSRTDSFVHALGQVVTFVTQSNIPPERFYLAMNTKLPRDIRVRKSYLADDTFHPRYDVVSKTYRYVTLLVDDDSAGLAIYRNGVNIEKRKDIKSFDKMNEAAELMVGKQDYASFCSAGSSAKTTIRDVKRFDISREKVFDFDLLVFEVEADGFLYNMVRIMSSILLLVGKQEMSLLQVKEIIAKKDRTFAPPPAKPQGLYLCEVKYE